MDLDLVSVSGGNLNDLNGLDKARRLGPEYGTHERKTLGTLLNIQSLGSKAEARRKEDVKGNMYVRSHQLFVILRNSPTRDIFSQL